MHVGYNFERRVPPYECYLHVERAEVDAEDTLRVDKRREREKEEATGRAGGHDKAPPHDDGEGVDRSSRPHY